MIRSAIIQEFGPMGLTFYQLDAPGSMCVMTVPGVTRPAPPPRIRYVVAGDRREYEQYLRAHSLTDGRDAVYVCDPTRFHGVTRGRFVMAGRWTGREDVEAIFDLIGHRKGSELEATIEFDRLDWGPMKIGWSIIDDPSSFSRWAKSPQERKSPMSCKSESCEAKAEVARLPEADDEARGKAFAREARKLGRLVQDLDRQLVRNRESFRELELTRSEVAQAYLRAYGEAARLLLPEKVNTYPEYH